MINSIVPEIKLGHHVIGAHHRPFIIAEMSGNHNNSLEKALEIVRAAAKAGVHALKIQTYTAETMTLNIDRGEFSIRDSKSLWNGRTLYDLYEEASTPWEWHKPIFDLCQELGLLGFSTPFDFTAIDFLEKLEVPFYKIASFEMVDLPLIRRVAQTKKPIIMSTGMATVIEIAEAVEAARLGGCRDLILLKCTSNYPASPVDTNLATLKHMSSLFKTQVGLSDHTMGLGAAVAAVSLGATVIEKHFTLARKDGGVDSEFSLEPAEMAALVIETERAWQALGEISYGPTNREKPSLQFRRSIYVVEDTKAGEVFTEKNIRTIRPGFGLAPKHYDGLLGRKAVRNIAKGTPASWDLFC